MRKFIVCFSIISIILTLAGCGDKKSAFSADTFSNDYEQSTSYDDYSTQSSYDIQTSPSSSSVYTPPAELDENILTLIEKEVSFGNNDFSALENQLSKITVKYPYEELYGIKDAYKKYTSLPKYTSTHKNFFADGVFTADELFNIIKTNNAKANYQPQKQITDSDLQYVCKIIAPLLLEYGKNMSANDASLLSEKINDLKIYTFTGFSAGCMDTEKCEMGLDVTQKNTDTFQRTVQHETHHMIQGSSLKENQTCGYKCRLGFAYSFDDKDQPLDFRWIYEASAELLTHNRLNSRNFDVYEFTIQFIDYIKVATILRDDLDETSFEKLTLSTNLDGLFDYFDCRTDKQKQEILNMVAAINYKENLQDCAKGFKERFEKKYGTNLKPNDLQYAIINPLGTALSREFFKNLSNALKGEKLKVKDVFILNALFEHRLVDRSFHKGAEFCADMLLTYRKLQTELFKIIANKLKITVDELYAAYDVYYVKAEITANNIPLVSTKEADFLQYTTNSSLNERYRTVNQSLVRIGK